MATGNITIMQSRFVKSLWKINILWSARWCHWECLCNRKLVPIQTVPIHPIGHCALSCNSVGEKYLLCFASCVLCLCHSNVPPSSRIAAATDLWTGESSDSFPELSNKTKNELLELSGTECVCDGWSWSWSCGYVSAVHVRTFIWVANGNCWMPNRTSINMQNSLVALSTFRLTQELLSGGSQPAPHKYTFCLALLAVSSGQMWIKCYQQRLPKRFTIM